MPLEPLRKAADHRYYRRNRAKILAKAKARYAYERQLKLEIAKKVREEVNLRSKESSEQPNESIPEPNPLTQPFQWLTAKLGLSKTPAEP